MRRRGQQIASPRRLSDERWPVGEPDRKVTGPAHLAGGPSDCGGVIEFEVGDAVEPRLDGHSEFHPGQVRSETSVDPDAEGEVAVHSPIQDDLFWVVERVGVSVGGGEGEQHSVARAHEASVVLGVVEDLSGHRDGCECSEELLGGGVDELGFGAEPMLVRRVCGEVVQGRSDGGPRRVDAGEEQEDAHAEDLVATQGTPVG